MRDAPVNDKLRIELGFAATSGTGSDSPVSGRRAPVVEQFCVSLISIRRRAVRGIVLR